MTQGETLSPSLFLLAIDPLLRTIQRDTSISGIKVGTQKVKVMAYADDIVLISDNKDDLEKMLEHVRTYSKASNAKLSERKCQILSFGSEKIECIGNIRRCPNTERVRHLGVFFNEEGIVNNLGEIFEKLEKKLSLLRNLFPIFTTKVNIWKGYAISALLYHSEVLCITPEQVRHFEKLEKWFLFTNSHHEGQVVVFQPHKTYTANIRLERLKEPVANGGRNLPIISDVFSMAKAKTLARAMTGERKFLPCYTLIRERCDELYLMQSKHNLVHPLFSDKNSPKTLRQWEWFAQAAPAYQKLKKECSTFPQSGEDLVLNTVSKQVIKCSSISNFSNGVANHFPVGAPSSSKYRKITPKNATKAPLQKWKRPTVLKLVRLGQKPSLRDIAIATRHNQETKVLWTSKQKKMIDDLVPLKSLLTTKLHSLAKIEDFMWKLLTQFWIKIKNKGCALCGEEEFSPEHLLIHCKKVRSWERHLDIDAEHPTEKRLCRKKHQFTPPASTSPPAGSTTGASGSATGTLSSKSSTLQTPCKPRWPTWRDS